MRLGVGLSRILDAPFVQKKRKKDAPFVQKQPNMKKSKQKIKKIKKNGS